jgi:gamma-glutamyltranspeptidase/glutathione hydrolase
METTHYSVVDSSGMAVSVTTTINGAYGSKVVVDGVGFFLNNEMDDFSVKPGVPNMYGLVGSEANAIEPEKRMLSSMSPTIVEDPEGRLFMVIGTPGGATIITTVFQVIQNVIDHGMNMQAAVAAPRVHHQWKPDELRHEPDALTPDVAEALQARGWKLTERAPWGRADGILVQYDTAGRRLYQGGADPRGDDKAIGY